MANISSPLTLNSNMANNYTGSNRHMVRPSMVSNLAMGNSSNMASPNTANNQAMANHRRGSLLTRKHTAPDMFVYLRQNIS
jgi:hypothetical protein